MLCICCTINTWRGQKKRALIGLKIHFISILIFKWPLVRWDYVYILKRERNSSVPLCSLSYDHIPRCRSAVIVRCSASKSTGPRGFPRFQFQVELILLNSRLLPSSTVFFFWEGGGHKSPKDIYLLQ